MRFRSLTLFSRSDGERRRGVHAGQQQTRRQLRDAVRPDDAERLLHRPVAGGRAEVLIRDPSSRTQEGGSTRVGVGGWEILGKNTNLGNGTRSAPVLLHTHPHPHSLHPGHPVGVANAGLCHSPPEGAAVPVLLCHQCCEEQTVRNVCIRASDASKGKKNETKH